MISTFESCGVADQRRAGSSQQFDFICLVCADMRSWSPAQCVAVNRENARVTLREGVERDVVFDVQRRQFLNLNSPLGREHFLQPQFRNSPTGRQLPI
ncbi:hypothetical protein [Rhodobacter calidifons]|uniref:Uncharacterized protein n=1 Tax=Rhodobacter calidifons TaxID=2715277 RepID=A0ABX0G5B4_9RHOB|nr:hypothetical protein [Rhodobacter calidifons]NHB76404.1 hypothetical protein [Rhodobacter calidifons]